MTENFQPRGESIRRFRAIWMSDFHLGTPGTKTEPLLDFLRSHECETLYLVGDIIDISRLQHRWFWPESHSEVLAIILEKARQGTRVIFIPGNHDDALRSLVGSTIAGIEIHHDCIHTTSDGKRLLIVHGDEFHGVIKKNSEKHLGDRVFDMVFHVDAALGRAGKRAGIPYNRVSSFVSRKAKSLASSATHYVDKVVAEAVRRDAVGVICGHNHVPSAMQSAEFFYGNDGDWVESCTALVEPFAGQLQLARQDGHGWAYAPATNAPQNRGERRRRVSTLRVRSEAKARVNWRRILPAKRKKAERS